MLMYEFTLCCNWKVVTVMVHMHTPKTRVATLEPFMAVVLMTDDEDAGTIDTK